MTSEIFSVWFLMGAALVWLALPSSPTVIPAASALCSIKKSAIFFSASKKLS